MKINDDIKTDVISIGPGYYINVIEDYSSSDLSYEVSDFYWKSIQEADKLRFLNEIFTYHRSSSNIVSSQLSLTQSYSSFIKNELLRKYEASEGKMDQSGNDSSGGGVKFGDEDDEEESPEEKQVAEFLECCRRQPQQLLRYQLNGRPLTLDYQYSQGQLVPSCSACGAQRSFEFQLMPYLAHISNMSFGTIQIFTCLANCSRKEGSLNEYALLQLEPDANKFR